LSAARNRKTLPAGALSDSMIGVADDLQNDDKFGAVLILWQSVHRAKRNE
jgi:hypothetical protein